MAQDFRLSGLGLFFGFRLSTFERPSLAQDFFRLSTSAFDFFSAGPLLVPDIVPTALELVSAL